METTSNREHQYQEYLDWYNRLLVSQDNLEALELMARAPFAAVRVTQPLHFTGYSPAVPAHPRLRGAERELTKLVCDIKARITRGEDDSSGHSVSAQIHRCASGGYRQALDQLAQALELVLGEIVSTVNGRQLNEAALDSALDLGEQALAYADEAERRAAVPILAARVALARKRGSRRSSRGSRQPSKFRR